MNVEKIKAKIARVKAIMARYEALPVEDITEQAASRYELATRVLAESESALRELEATDPWSCCGVPVRTVGLSVQCQGACGRTSR